MSSDYKIKAAAAIAEIAAVYTGQSKWFVEDTMNRPFSVAYSGGKDSTVTAALVLRSLLLLKPAQRNRKIYITSAQTHLDMTTDPVKQREFLRMKKVITLFNLPVEIVEVESDIENSFLFLVLGLGYALPSNRGNRWCTERLKLTPQQKYMKELDPALTFIGVRSSESASRAESIQSRQASKFYTTNKSMMPIVDFTLDDVWAYLALEKTPWGDAEEISQLYKDATGECGLSKRKAGAGEKVDDPCGARFGCIICPLVTIDKSSQEMAKKYPWFQPYVDIRDIMIEMYQIPDNRAGYMRDGRELFYGEGNFNIRARMELFDLFMKAQQENERLALMYGVEPQPIFTDELIERIRLQWEIDAQERPWLADAVEIGLFFEERPKGIKGKRWQVPGQITWNDKFVG